MESRLGAERHQNRSPIPSRVKVLLSILATLALRHTYNFLQRISRNLSPGVKRPWRETDRPLHLVPRLKKSGSLLSLPLCDNLIFNRISWRWLNWIGSGRYVWKQQMGRNYMKEYAGKTKKQDTTNIFTNLFPLVSVQSVYVTCSYYRLRLWRCIQEKRRHIYFRRYSQYLQRSRNICVLIEWTNTLKVKVLQWDVRRRRRRRSIFFPIRTETFLR
jgi:hypothetical protein